MAERVDDEGAVSVDGALGDDDHALAEITAVRPGVGEVASDERVWVFEVHDVLLDLGQDAQNADSSATGPAQAVEARQFHGLARLCAVLGPARREHWVPHDALPGELVARAQRRTPRVADAAQTPQRIAARLQPELARRAVEGELWRGPGIEHEAAALRRVGVAGRLPLGKVFAKRGLDSFRVHGARTRLAALDALPDCVDHRPHHSARVRLLVDDAG
mmetsp:Transcript_7561/g.24643  ORF Transcript_7561/g.24643 Transcript_7561/m.24643 type:complete len:218 (-) Transcript_7561:93-746(-)